MHSSSPDTVISWLVDAVSKNGNLLLNVSPKADGTIPMDQQETLLGVGKWLETNGEAIYDTHSWIRFEETGRQHIYFTVKSDVLYAIVIGDRSDVLITSLARGQAAAGRVGEVSLLGSKEHLSFSQDSSGLRVKLPGPPPGESAYTLKITGLQMNPPTWTVSGDPMSDNGKTRR